MIARLWKTGIDPARTAEYDAFADGYSRPMFAALPGCLGAIFLGNADVRWVLSLWSDPASIEALRSASLYRDTVARLQATGILRDPQTVELFEVTGGTVHALGLATALSTLLTP